MKPLANLALTGYVLFVLAAGGLGVLAGSAFLFGLGPAWIHLPAGLAGAVAAGVGLHRADARVLAGAGAGGVVLLASASNGLPNLTGWLLAILGGLGLLLYAENAVLLLRLEKVRKAEGAGEGLDKLALEMRRAETGPVLLVGAALLGSVLLARGVLLLADPALASSVEAGSGYGLALVTALVCGGVLLWQWARGRPT